MDFLEWNDAIASHFFRPDASGRTVYLYVTQDVIEKIGGTDSLAGFVDVMKGGPSWATRQGLCQRALQCLDGWRDRSLQYPPYVGYLALFVLAARTLTSEPLIDAMHAFVSIKYTFHIPSDLPLPRYLGI